MRWLRRQTEWIALVLALMGLGALAQADEFAAESDDSLFSRNYEGRLEPVVQENGVLDAFKVRDYPIFYVEFHTAAIQSESLDRIGIFVESDRYHGKILAPQLMQKLDEEALFDGHDYDSVDLARFYSLAARYAIRLHPMEIRMRELLIRLDVLEEQGGHYVAKRTAALLTAVRGMDERHGAGTRRWVLDHEFRHGYYFVTLRDQVHEIWQEMLSRDEREIIADTLRRTAQYNSDDDSLMEREFHAMVFESRFEDDLQGLWTRGFDTRSQPKKSDIDELIDKLPKIRRAFVEMEQRLTPSPSGVSDERRHSID